MKRNYYADLMTCALLSGVFLVAGCGYTTKGLIPEHIKTIKIARFTNAIDVTKEISDRTEYQVYVPGLEIQVTKAIIDRFIFDGNLKVVTEEDAADSILTGEVIDYRKDALRFDKDDNVEEYRVSILINMRLSDQRKGGYLWEADGFAGDASFRLSGQFAGSESAARQSAIEDLAQRVVERAVEDW